MVYGLRGSDGKKNNSGIHGSCGHRHRPAGYYGYDVRANISSLTTGCGTPAQGKRTLYVKDRVPDVSAGQILLCRFGYIRLQFGAGSNMYWISADVTLGCRAQRLSRVSNVTVINLQASVASEHDISV